MESTITGASLVALAAGIASHVLYFNRYECHMYGFLYLWTFFAAFIVGVLTLSRVHNFALGQAILNTSGVAASYLAGVYGSTLIYRIFLNPLNKLPGPWPARICNLWFSLQTGNCDAYYKLLALHKKYGPIVRIGSNDLSIVDPDVMETAYGPNSRITKSPWYDGDKPLTSMHTSRDKALHDKRRKVWAPAFSDKALREYETVIDDLNAKVVERFSDPKIQPINVRKWFNLYSFDAMGRLAFGKDYGMLDSGEKQESLDLLSEGMQPLAHLLPIWLFRMLVQTPGLGAGFKKFIRFCIDELTWRVEHAGEAEEKGRTDIMSSILKAYKGMKQPQNDPMLQADSRLIIVAGSDTTAATLTFLFYHLAKDPSQVKKLRDELRPLCQGDWHDVNIRQAPLLNGVINEALRLHPPVPSGVSRLTPKEGMKVGNQWIPGNTVFLMPQYVMGRDDSIYPEANEFIPERWGSKPELVRHKDAFAPFSMGPFGCIGKNLALIELRTLTARLVLAYDMKLAPGEDGNRLLYKTLDHFTVDPGDLDIVFTKAT